MANLKQIEAYLNKIELPYRVVKLKSFAYTVSDVVKSGIEPSAVVKTLIVRIPEDKFIALALRGTDRVDFKKIRSVFGSRAELANPSEVEEVVRVPVGAVCPILLEIPLYFDRKVLKLKNIHMGSGDLKHGLEMSLGDLFVAVGSYKAIDFSL